MRNDALHTLVSALNQLRLAPRPKPERSLMHPFDYRKFRQSTKTANMVNRLKRIR